jgi:hypothetical protein
MEISEYVANPKSNVPMNEKISQGSIRAVSTAEWPALRRAGRLKTHVYPIRNPA